MKTLLDHQWSRWVISILPGVFVFFWAYRYYEPIQYTLLTYMPGALISLMGFVIAGAAIVVSMRGQGVLKVFADQSPKNWNRLMAQFFRASRYCIIYTFFLLLSDALPLPEEDAILTRVIYSVSAAGFTLVLLQLSMAMTALEGASLLSSKPGGTAGESPQTEEVGVPKIFNRPNSNNRIYENQSSHVKGDDG